MASLVEILIKAKDQVSAVIDGITGSLDGLGKGAEDAEQVSSDAFGDIFDSAMTAFVGINQGVELAIKAFDLLKGAYEGTVGKVLEIANEVGELSRVSGDAPENMSALRLEAEKAKVPFDDLYKAMENLNKNGVAPTIDNLMAIAQEYVNLQDPIAQAKLLTENFGTAGDDIAPMLEAIAGGITAVQDAGLIFTQEEIDQAKAYETAVAELGVAWEGLASTIGMAVIPGLTDFVGQVQNSLGSIGLLAEYMGALNDAANSGRITPSEWFKGVGDMLTLDLAGANSVSWLTEQINELNGSFDKSIPTFDEFRRANADAADMVEAFGDNTKKVTGTIGSSLEPINATKDGINNLSKAAIEAAVAQEKLDASMYKAIANLGERYTPLLKDIAENEADIVELQTIIEQGGGMFDGQWMSAEQAKQKIIELTTEIENARLAMEGLAAQAVAGIAWGQITADAKVSLEEITRYYDFLVASGIMSADAGKQAIKDFMEYWGLWDPEAKPLPVETTLDSSESDNYTPPTKKQLVEMELDTSNVDGYAPPTKYGTVKYLVNGVNPNTVAAGGMVQAAAAGLAASLPYYWVGERGPEPFFPSVDGRIVSNTQAMSALRGGGANATDIANAVKQGVKEAMRDTGGGKTFNLTMPTSSNPADVRTAFELMEAWA